MIDMESVARLGKDLRTAAATLSRDEARFLVDAYYQLQENRIRSAHQVRTLSASGEPHAVLEWLFEQNAVLEKQVGAALKRFAEDDPVGEWAMSIPGIGPVIASGLLAHIDIRKAPTVGHIWNYAGLNPSVTWNKGEKRPWNADLKRLCWLAGESFVKVQGNRNDVYGKVYAQRKQLEIERNENGDFADQAKASLAAKRYGETTDARKHYEAGRLPPARIHERAKRYAVKLFLSHLHHVWHWLELGGAPPKPFAIEHGGHAHFIPPPNWKEPS